MSLREIIEQACDGCSETRDLKKGENPDNGGWREVQTNKHLCPNCIYAALNK